MSNDLRTRAVQMAAWQYRTANRILSGENNVPPIVGANLAQSGGLTTDLLVRIGELEVAGDALAIAVRGQDLAGPGTWREQLDLALAGWAAARGRSEGDGGAEATPGGSP